MNFTVISYWNIGLGKFTKEQMQTFLPKESNFTVDDLVFIVDQPGYFVNKKCNILLQVEPEVIAQNQTLIIQNQHLYERIYTFNEHVYAHCSNAYFYVYGTTWITPVLYRTIDVNRKQWAASNLAGSKLFPNARGHAFRQSIHYNQRVIRECVQIPITFFRSSAQRPIIKELGEQNPLLVDKPDLFLDFQFAIVIENSRQNNYFTEKLMDCLLTKTIPIYYGCPNIANFFDVTGWIILEDESVESLMQKISTLKRDHYNNFSITIAKNFESALKYVDFAENLLCANNSTIDTQLFDFEQFKFIYGAAEGLHGVKDVTKIAKKIFLDRKARALCVRQNVTLNDMFSDVAPYVKKHLFVYYKNILIATVPETRDRDWIIDLSSINTVNDCAVGEKIGKEFVFLPDKLAVVQPAGFFSCCSVRLFSIVKFFNLYHALPKTIDNVGLFEWYKPIHTRVDITLRYFCHESSFDNKIKYERSILYHWSDQFSNYKDIDYNAICPIIRHYFSPSAEVEGIVTAMECKYALDYENLCVLFYRGNDKATETTLPTYAEMAAKAHTLQMAQPNLQFLVQSDETEFIRAMLAEFPNSIVFFDEIRHIERSRDNTVDKIAKESNLLYSLNFLAITIIMSRCHNLIVTSGNCSLWICFFRGNASGLLQNLNGAWL